MTSTEKQKPGRLFTVDLFYLYKLEKRVDSRHQIFPGIPNRLAQGKWHFADRPHPGRTWTVLFQLRAFHLAQYR